MTLQLKAAAKQVGGETHIHPTDLELARDGFNVLLGTTLAGKTTLMQIMAGLQRPSAGQVWFNGQDVTGVSVQKRNVSFVHQQFINYPAMSVFDNIASPLRVARMSRAEIDRRVGEAAELLRLTPMLGRRPSELSGGQQQRTALARAIVKDSDLVLLDEPLANLDFKLREELREELPRLFADKGAIVVYATTEPVEALLLGGHTACLHEGRVTAFGPTSELYRAPPDLTSASVLSDPPMNAAAVHKQGGEMVMTDTIRWPAPDIPDGAYTMGLRPHHVVPDGPGVNIEGHVLVTELSGSESTAHFDLDGRIWVSQAPGVHPFEVGSAHGFAMDVSRALYFDAAGRLMAG